MKIGLLILLLGTFNFSFGQDNELNNNQVKNITRIITFFQQRNIDSIATIIRYPLERNYPLSDIENPKELKSTFNEIFDSTLISEIANSKIKQWSEMGWRGVMLNNGIVWTDGYTGKIIGINYQSGLEKRIKQRLIQEHKQNLYFSIREFKEPVCKIETKNYLIRIDKLADGSLRYVSWKSGEKESTKPGLVLNSGKLEFQGSGGNNVITFSNGDYKYKVYRNILGNETTPPVELVVEKQGKVILSENGKYMAK